MKPAIRIISRRDFLLAASGIAAGIALDPAAAAERATAAAMQEAIRMLVGSAQVRKGKVTLELPPLVENGNAVSLAVRVDSPMTRADHVKAIHVFTEKNPQPNVVAFHLGPRAGRASVATRIRLADTQSVVAIAMSDNVLVRRAERCDARGLLGTVTGGRTHSCPAARRRDHRNGAGIHAMECRASTARCPRDIIRRFKAPTTANRSSRGVPQRCREPFIDSPRSRPRAEHRVN